jgi:hypothetical protein
MKEHVWLYAQPIKSLVPLTLRLLPPKLNSVNPTTVLEQLLKRDYPMMEAVETHKKCKILESKLLVTPREKTNFLLDQLEKHSESSVQEDVENLIQDQ